MEEGVILIYICRRVRVYYGGIGMIGSKSCGVKSRRLKVFIFKCNEKERIIKKWYKFCYF